MMKAGIALKDVYATAVNIVKTKKPELESAFVKSIGFAVSYCLMND
jgi:nucleosome binding factor SPN SPT16 subunit